MTSTLRPSAPPMEERDLLECLDQVATELERRWTAALANGSFRDIDRYVNAAHAVHRAQMELRDDRPVWRSRR